MLISYLTAVKNCGFGLIGIGFKIADFVRDLSEQNIEKMQKFSDEFDIDNQSIEELQKLQVQIAKRIKEIKNSEKMKFEEAAVCYLEKENLTVDKNKVEDYFSTHH